MTLQVGDQAPDFTLRADNNQMVALKDFRGRNVILYFYPKDHTPGCTRQACDFRDQFAQFDGNNTVIIGISKDSTERHQRFKTKYNLPFILLTDDTAKVCQAYGVMKKKSLFGNTFLGIQRTTFLIDENGTIQALWRNVKVPGHIQQVLDELTESA